MFSLPTGCYPWALRGGAGAGEGSIEMMAGGTFCHAELKSKRGRVELWGFGIEVGSALTEDETAQLDSMAVDDPEWHAKRKTLVKIGAGEGDGGLINVYNPFGKQVVTVQSDKTNQGAVIGWHIGDATFGPSDWGLHVIFNWVLGVPVGGVVGGIIGVLSSPLLTTFRTILASYEKYKKKNGNADSDLSGTISKYPTTLE